MSNPANMEKVKATLNVIRGNKSAIDPNSKVSGSEIASSKRTSSAISTSTVFDASSEKQAPKRSRGTSKKASEPNVELAKEAEESVLAQSSQVSRFLAVE